MRFGGFGYEQQFGFGLSPTPAASAAPAYAAWPALVGAEMMVNGDCSSGTGWTGIVIAGGKGTLTAITGAVENSGITFADFLVATYRCVFTIDTAAGGSINWNLSAGEGIGASRSSPGTYSEDIAVLGANSGGFLDVTSATMQLDNFSVKSIGLMGVSGDWTLTIVTFTAGGNLMFSGDPAQEAELTGSAATAFNAAVSNSTACEVTLTPKPDSPLGGDFSVSLKGGTPVIFSFAGEGTPITETVTSGTGSGFSVTTEDGGGELARIQIALA